MYLFLTISCHKPSSFSNIHHHLQSKLIFIFLIFLIPKPPFFLDLQIFPHLTRWYFFLQLPSLPEELFPSSIHPFNGSQRHKKHRHMVSNQV
jgi:hypothetical protein